MASLQNQTSINPNRYFFATKDDGEQELYTTTVAAGNITDFYVGINGASGNQVQINQMPDIIGTTSVGGEEMLYSGTASTYKTLSSITTTAVGTSISFDRNPASGLTTIENYAGNGSYKGFEFLARGVDSALVSTAMDSYMTAIGSPGAIAKLGGNGQFVVGQSLVGLSAISLNTPDVAGSGTGCFNIADLSGGNAITRWSWYKYGNETGGNAGTNLALGAYSDTGNFIAAALQANRATGTVTAINAYPYPQAVVSVPAVSTSPGAVTVPNATVTVVLTITGANALVAGLNYLTDINFTFSATNATANAAWLQFGVRLGGNGAFNYEPPIYIPVGGTGLNIAMSLNQISDMGSSAPGVIDIVAYQQNIAAGAITVTATTSSSSPPHLLKNIT